MAQCNNAGASSNTVGNNSVNGNSFAEASAAAAAAANNTVQQVANAVAAAVIASEHQNHLNNLKSRFQPSSSGRPVHYIDISDYP